jgi:hypothetical protein
MSTLMPVLAWNALAAARHHSSLTPQYTTTVPSACAAAPNSVAVMTPKARLFQ